MKRLISNISSWSMGTRLIIVIVLGAVFSTYRATSQFNTVSGADAATIQNANANTTALGNQLKNYQEALEKIVKAVKTIKEFKNALKLIDLAQAVYCSLKDIDYLMDISLNYEGFDACRRQFELDVQMQRLDMAVKEVEVALSQNKDLTTSDRVNLVGTAIQHLSEANNGIIKLRTSLRSRVRSQALDRYINVQGRNEIKKVMSFSIYDNL